MALDGWRGICACLVVIFHVGAYSHLYGFLHSFYLCVDFFFVLSGFVITASYRTKLLAGFSYRKFLALRLGRVYPLHIFMLTGLLAFHLTKTLLIDGFTNRSYSLDTFVGNIFLVQSLGLFQHLSWNGPSWSISVEFYTYVVFVLGLFLLRRRIWILELVMILTSPFIFLLTGQKMNATYHLGLLRCAYGFSAGCLCYQIHAKFSDRRIFDRVEVMNVAELLSIMAAATFLYYAGPTAMSAFAPYVFSIMIFVFAKERGFVSGALSAGPLVFLGKISYSIYMTHFLIIELFFNAAGMLAHFLGKNLHTTLLEDGREVKLLGTQVWHGDVILLSLLAATITASHFTYKLVEDPAYRWSKRVAQKFPDKTRRRNRVRVALMGNGEAR